LAACRKEGEHDCSSAGTKRTNFINSGRREGSSEGKMIWAEKGRENITSCPAGGGAFSAQAETERSIPREGRLTAKRRMINGADATGVTAGKGGVSDELREKSVRTSSGEGELNTRRRYASSKTL